MMTAHLHEERMHIDTMDFYGDWMDKVFEDELEVMFEPDTRTEEEKRHINERLEEIFGPFDE